VKTVLSSRHQLLCPTRAHTRVINWSFEKSRQKAVGRFYPPAKYINSLSVCIYMYVSFFQCSQRLSEIRLHLCVTDTPRP
jgi:hypothetical protein